MFNADERVSVPGLLIISVACVLWVVAVAVVAFSGTELAIPATLGLIAIFLIAVSIPQMKKEIGAFFKPTPRRGPSLRKKIQRRPVPVRPQRIQLRKGY
ncbi:MAG: hypothetical protein ACE5DK_00705 [Paracoccaceae bacterium]